MQDDLIQADSFQKEKNEADHIKNLIYDDGPDKPFVDDDKRENSDDKK